MGRVARLMAARMPGRAGRSPSASRSRRQTRVRAAPSSSQRRSGAEQKTSGVGIELLYLGAPTYRIKVTAPDYKKAEKAIEKAANAAIAVVEKAGGEGRLVKKPKSGKSQ